MEKILRKMGGARKQNSLQHTESIVLLGIIILEKLKPYITLDESLLISSLAVHDIGEGEIKKDTAYIDKNHSGDLEEYLAFRKSHETLGQDVFRRLNEAFLLQFANKNPENFPEDSRKIMAELAKNKLMEALVFDAIERWDYVLWAVEQYIENKNIGILVWTLRNQSPHMDRLSSLIPGLKETVWTKEISDWSRQFLDTNKNIEEERKS